ncbi:hypothetical protein GQX73_g2325 [Xylaria multiplex]|uniref:DUF7918 domain-containing protein n=1 Tax=Xylaria multiplex TaxID=323545 RepID=A0A7C8N240_9PEZI|nr:hypothetical protein GQX73_g2325 [Xylaria multiplex]
MPYFRGIEISIHASLEAKQVAEYPHPDGSSVRLMRPTAPPVICSGYAGVDGASQPNALSTLEEVDPTRLKKVNPRISVYIPSLPGEQFWLRYLINQSPPPSRCIFFKMTMNGRHISSWGTNTNTRTAGIVVRALYRPEDKWGDAYDHNDARYPGIETRYFHFMPGLDKKSIAEDGGIIEVQVFRCKGRKRIALELDTYRSQERYGIAVDTLANNSNLPFISSPSGGLVDNPEDATYYNYYLIDAKDSPYATFCFHYRSMKYLKQLNLAPQLGLDMSPVSRGSFDLQRERSGVMPSSDSTSPPPRRFTFDGVTLGPEVFDDDVGTTERGKVERADANLREEYFLKSPSDLSPSSLGGRALEMELSGEIQQRPLPDIPNFQARPASASSLCPSLTPSLKQYVESEDFDNEEIRLSTAQPMLITSESMQALELVDAGVEEGTSFSDYAGSPTSTEASESPKLPSPADYIPTTGSVLERHLTQYDDSFTMKSSPPKTQKTLSCGADNPLKNEQIEPRIRVLSLTESEWLRHTPSPSQPKDTQVEHPWSPRSEPCIGGTARGPDDSTQCRDPRSHGTPDHTDAVSQAPIGNWI